MGLAWPQLAVMGTTQPFVNTAIKQGSLAKGEFGVKLAETGSELFIGGVNTALTSGKLTTVPVTTQGYWQVSMDAVSVSGKSVIPKIEAIVDTGTTLIVGTTDTVATFYKSIKGAADASSTVGDGFFTCESWSVKFL
jgi:cathepsin D